MQHKENFKLYLRLKYGFEHHKNDYKLYKSYSSDNCYLMLGYHISKYGSLKELKAFLRKQYKKWYKIKQSLLAKLIGEPITLSKPIPSVMDKIPIPSVMFPYSKFEDQS